MTDRERRVLVCEDRLEMYKKMARVLLEHGCTSEHVRNSVQLEARLRRMQEDRKWFDLIMIDMDLSLAEEKATGTEIYYRLAPDFPNESWLIYTSQSIEEIRSTVSELALRHVDVLLLNPTQLKQDLGRALARALPRSDPRSVFLVHGRDLEKKRRVEKLLVSGFGLSVIDWENARRRVVTTARDYVLEIVLAGIKASQAVVVLFTGDERVELKEELRGGGAGNSALRLQSRANVYIEAGYSIGARPGRTVLVECVGSGASLDQPSDLGGIHVVRFDEGEDSRAALLQRIESARCEVTVTEGWRAMDLA